MNFAAIEKYIATLGERARTGVLDLEWMQGGTFPIRNGGMLRSLLSNTILSMPQSTMLGTHIIRERPTVIDKKIVIRTMMFVALSYELSLIDDRKAVTFSCSIKTLTEDQRRL